MSRTYPSPEVRFWAAIKRTPTGCWEYCAYRSKAGYGRIFINGKYVAAHRFSWEFHNRPIPKGLRVLHRCDNRPCVRPDHLFIGTDKDNIDDMIKKGRAKNPRGIEHGQAKLTPDLVRILRLGHMIGCSIRGMAEQHGVTPMTAWRAIKGITWGHVR